MQAIGSEPAALPGFRKDMIFGFFVIAFRRQSQLQMIHRDSISETREQPDRLDILVSIHSIFF
jgi:hypothetical protein